MPSPSPADGNQALGIAAFRTSETPEQLDVVGVDAEGATKARIAVRLGHVELEDEQLAGKGREMVAEIAGKTMRHESVGTRPVSLPAPADDQLNLLVNDPYVAALLLERGIEIADVALAVVAAPADDQDYGHGGSCAGFTANCSGTGNTGCCLQHLAGNLRRQVVLCGNLYPTGSTAERNCTGAGTCGAGNGTYPNCIAEGPMTCPSGSSKAQNEGYWLCSNTCGDVGTNGCSVCSTSSYGWDTGEFWTSYTSGTDTCNTHWCGYDGWSCTSGASCCSGTCVSNQCVSY